MLNWRCLANKINLSPRPHDFRRCSFLGGGSVALVYFGFTCLQGFMSDPCCVCVVLKMSLLGLQSSRWRRELAAFL